MKIDKKLIKELVDCLSEFNITEIEYQDGDKKIKVSKAQKSSSEKNVTSAVSLLTKVFCLIVENKKVQELNRQLSELLI